MFWIEWSTTYVVPDHISSGLFCLNNLIVACLAGRLVVCRVNEQWPVSLMRGTMIDRGRDDSLALPKVTLTQWLPLKLLLAQSLRPTPDSQIVQSSMRTFAATLSIVLPIPDAPVERLRHCCYWPDDVVGWSEAASGFLGGRQAGCQLRHSRHQALRKPGRHGPSPCRRKCR